MHAFEQCADAALAGIRDRPMIGNGEGEFLVFGSNPELRLRLAARFEPGDKFVARVDRSPVDLITGHAKFRRCEGPRRYTDCAAKGNAAGSRSVFGLSRATRRLLGGI